MNLLDLFDEPEATHPDPAGPIVAFEDWRAEELDILRGLGRLETFAAGETVIDARAAEDRSLFIIVAGELEVHREGRRVAVLRPGDLVGELTFVDGRPRSGSVRALVASKGLRVRPEDLDRLGEREPAIALKFMREIARILCARLRAAWG